MRSLALLALAVMPFACTRRAESPPIAAHATAPGGATASLPSASGPVAAPSAPAASPSAPPRDAGPPAPPAPASWKDEAIVAELARDCAWEPPADDSSRDETPSGRPNLLSCKFLFEQSCVPDPCLDVQEETCKPKCTAGCDACGKRCVTGCGSCKRACQDDACKRACAASCGACRDACVGAADRCVTGGCGAAREKCNAARAASLAKHKRACAKVCQMASECPGTCSAGGDMSGCMAACRTRFLAGGCPSEFFGTCVMGGPGALGLPLPTP